jgi:hypothetical protein
MLKALRPQILAFTRICEDLLSDEEPMTQEECHLLDYYVNELVREFLSDTPLVRLREVLKPPVGA